jgi:hypothetical protein
MKKHRYTLSPRGITPDGLVLIEGNTLRSISRTGQISTKMASLSRYLPEVEELYLYDWDALKMEDILLLPKNYFKIIYYNTKVKKVNNIL